MDWSSFWLGYGVFPLTLLGLGVLWLIIDWILWWWDDPAQRMGRGRIHEVETIYPENGKWGEVEHTHYWPPGTPWWLVHRMEWLRLWACLRRPDYRPVTPRISP